MTLFIPITKVDKAKRLVYGRLSQEVPDKSGEILDYESSKDAFQKWSDDQFKASGGKSRGNLRAMHDNIAAGIFTEINFDDDTLSIEGCAKVVDDAEWMKVETGTYTGFSIGGGYAKRWTDPTNPNLKRYTPELAEVSLVDSPCVPTATFDFIKEDGSSELRKFNAKQEVAMTTETITEAEKPETETASRPQDKGGVVQGFMAKDGSFHVKKADALQRNTEKEAEEIAAPALEALKKLDEAVTKAEAKEEEAAPAEAEPAKADESEAKPEAEKATLAEDLNKGMYTVSRFAEMLQAILCLQQDTEWEAEYEGDDSELPGKMKTWLSDGGALLVQMVGEEAADLTAEKAAESVELAKRGAKLSATSKDHIDKMHKSASDHMAEMDKCYKALGMGEDDNTDKGAAPADLTKAVAERDALQKVLGDITPQLDALLKRIDHLEKQPLPAKGALRAVNKGTDGGNVSDGDDAKKAEEMLKGMTPDEISRMLMKSALARPQPGHPSQR